MIPEKDWEIYEAMRDYGGSFVQHLAELLHYADEQNYRKLRTVFREYFDSYQEIAQKHGKKTRDNQ